MILAGPDLGLATVAVIIGIVLIVRGGLLIAAGWQLRPTDAAVDLEGSVEDGEPILEAHQTGSLVLSS